MGKMTVEQLADAIAANYKKAIEIGREVMIAGKASNEKLQERGKHFAELTKWMNGGQAWRKKEEMVDLYKRSLRMVEAYQRFQ